MEVLNSSELKLEDLINQAKTVVVVISTSWCGPCKGMVPILEGLSNELSDTKIFKVDVSENIPQFVINMGIRAVPTFLIFRNGAQVNMASGAKSREQMIELININVPEIK